MQKSFTARTVVTLIAMAVLGAPLVGCGEVPAEGATDHVKSQKQLQMEAEVLARKGQAYEGDPWEKRFREQFWATQHIHDSWNRCHLGENVPRALQQGPGC
ncbi:hypothetical protein [Nocardioides sp.]|uniref:hypothetical protein n=1 Tax=Nocardioides sp. TaxID=35761 RepID=UPI002ED3CE70